jgi:hemolysin III
VTNLPVTVLPRHYPSPGAKCADLVVHITGLVFALFGGGILLGLAVGMGSLSQIAALGVYAAGLLAMLGFSTAYNFGKAPWRPTLRRLDHAGIFLMIAGSYTPFTTHSLSGAWAWGMTSAVWAIALFGVAGKLFLPGLGRRFWVGVYLALGWCVVVALKPMISGVSWVALMLLAIGGLVYTSGVIFYVNKKLKFARAIWHGHVVAAAGVHWAAILVGVVIAVPR